jgi:DNA-binding PadR family transcriptional regulator
MPPRSLVNPLTLVILGLLAEQPLHPYAMRVLMRERGHDRIVGRAPSSLYDAVNRLNAAGLIETHAAEQEGGRPERTVYRLTANGLDSLQGWVRQALADPERAGQFTAALSFMYGLPRDEVIGLLETRTTALEVLIEAGDNAISAALEAGVPAIFLSEGRYSHDLLRAQHDWLSAFTTQLRSGELSWPHPNPSPLEPS